MKECVLVLAGVRVTVVSDFGNRVTVPVSIGVHKTSLHGFSCLEAALAVSQV